MHQDTYPYKILYQNFSNLLRRYYSYIEKYEAWLQKQTIAYLILSNDYFHCENVISLRQGHTPTHATPSPYTLAYAPSRPSPHLETHPYNSNEIYFLQNHVALCTLHSNALYVKLFFVIYFWNSFLVLITLFGLLYSVLTSMLYVRALTLCMGTKLKWERMMILASKLGVWII